MPDGSIVKPKTTVKWLGIHFDNRLSFKEHVATRASKARSAFFRLCRLANSEKGLSPFALRQLYMACVVSVADYGCQVYWKNQAFARTQLQSLQNLGLRKILGAFRTTPIIPLEVEAALPPPAVRLNASLCKYAFRTQTLLARNHPIKQAMARAVDTSQISNSSEEDSDDTSHHTRSTPCRQLFMIASSITSTNARYQEKINPFQFRPWQMDTPYEVDIAQVSKEEAASAHNDYMQTRLGTSLLAIYGDASSVPNGTGVGVGIVAYNYTGLGEEVYQETLNIGKGQIVYNGELEGITRGFEYATTVASSYQEIRIFADNQAAIHRIKTPSDNPGQCWQLRCIEAANVVERAGASISLHWVPGHTDVPGNERADELAKEAAKMSPSSNTTSLALTGIRIKSLANKEWREHLNEYTPMAIQKNPRTYAAKFPWRIGKKLCIPQGTKRETASAFYQLKTGHGYNKSYLHRIGKSETDSCSCGARQTPEHLLLSCKRNSEARKKLVEEMGTHRLTLPLLLHSKQGIEKTLNFLERTRIGTRKWHLGQLEEEHEEEEGEGEAL